MFRNILHRPEKVFLIVCFIFGIIFLLINPPFQAPDEDNHLYKMYGYTEGSLNFKVKNGLSGQIIPKSLIEISNSYSYLPFHPFAKTSLKKTQQVSMLKLDKNNVEFFKLNMPSYSPVSYFPLIIVLWILKACNIPPLFMIFIMRLSSLFVYLGLAYAAIKIAPFKKWLFALVAMLPMSIYIAASINTDSLVIGLGFIFCAYTLKLAFDDNVSKVGLKELFYFFGLILLLAVCKYAYLPLLLFYFIIPKEKFVSDKYFYLGFVLICATTIFLSCSWILYNINLIKAIPVQGFPNRIDTAQFIAIQLQQPIVFLKTLFGSIFCVPFDYLSSAIGRFGWLDTYLPSKLTDFYLFFIIFVSLHSFKNDKVVNVNLQQKAIILVACLMAVAITFVSVYVLFQILSSRGFIMGMQGRYMLPFLPILLMIFHNNRFKFQLNVPVLISAFSLLLLYFSVIAILSRYYIEFFLL